MVIFQDIPSTPPLFVPLHVFLYQIKFLCPWNCPYHQCSVMPGQILAICQHTFHPAKRCSTVFFCWPHSQHLLHSPSPANAFHDFVSTICSSKVITDAVFLGVWFCLNHEFHPVFRILFSKLLLLLLLLLSSSSSSLLLLMSYFSLAYNK